MSYNTGDGRRSLIGQFKCGSTRKHPITMGCCEAAVARFFVCLHGLRRRSQNPNVHLSKIAQAMMRGRGGTTENRNGSKYATELTWIVVSLPARKSTAHQKNANVRTALTMTRVICGRSMRVVRYAQRQSFRWNDSNALWRTMRCTGVACHAVSNGQSITRPRDRYRFADEASRSPLAIMLQVSHKEPAL